MGGWTNFSDYYDEDKSPADKKEIAGSGRKSVKADIKSRMVYCDAKRQIGAVKSKVSEDPTLIWDVKGQIIQNCFPFGQHLHFPTKKQWFWTI